MSSPFGRVAIVLCFLFAGAEEKENMPCPVCNVSGRFGDIRRRVVRISDTGNLLGGLSHILPSGPVHFSLLLSKFLSLAFGGPY